MIPATISHYQLISLLGAGGMGEVYLAQDTKLDRKVAIKFLSSQSMSDAQANRRLIHEARAAATLDHPNICSIYEVAEEDGRAFIVMQYVTGETLASRIKRKALELKESIDVAVQVADAITEAHSHGLVHRDIKPSNIMLTSRNQVKVLDFGLASVIRDKTLINSEAVTESLLTEPGVIVGTLPYMSPEQVNGAVLDFRTDIFSFGAVVYEVISGHQPFASQTAAGTISAILTKEPPPLSRYAPESPAQLDWIVSKALRKDREERYETAKELLNDLRNLRYAIEFEAQLERSRSTEKDSAATRGLSLGQASAAQETEVDVIDEKPAIKHLDKVMGRRAWLGAVSALVLMTSILAYFLYFSLASKSIDSIVVLPFVNTSGDPNVEYLSDGISEALINSLTELQQLRVIARSTAFRYKNEEADPQVVGRNLKVGAVLTGRVRLVGDTLNVQVDLVDAQTGAQLWGKEYERKVSDVLSIKQGIAREVAAKLELRLSGQEQRQLVKHDTTNLEAYQDYLNGRYFWNKRTEEGFNKAIQYFQQSTGKDPNYALAYAGLADTYALLPIYGIATPNQSVPKAKDAAQRALSIDDTVAESHASLGWIFFRYEWDWAAAETEFLRAIQLKSSYSTAHHWFALFLSSLGRHDQALAEIRRALELEPFSLPINATFSCVLLHDRQYDAALDQARKAVEMDPGHPFALEQLGFALLERGDYDEASAALRTSGQSGISRAYARAGKRAEALSALHEGPRQRPSDVALTYAALGEKVKAFAWLEKAYSERDPALSDIKVNPRFDILRPEPLFQELLVRMRLD